MEKYIFSHKWRIKIPETSIVIDINQKDPPEFIFTIGSILKSKCNE